MFASFLLFLLTRTLGVFTTSKTKPGQNNQKQVPPGQFFRVPGMGSRTRWVPEGGNKNIKTTLTAGQTATAPTVKFDQADIVQGYLAVITWTATYTKGSGDTLHTAVFAPMNAVNRFKIQYEATYAPVNLTGIMAAVFQLFRPMFSGASDVGQLTNDTANVKNVKSPTGNWPSFTSLLTSTTGFAGATLTGLYSFKLFYELAVSITFDLYWPINKTGSLANPSPLPRRVISPQYMAATTRNNVPVVTFANPLLTSAAAGGRLPVVYRSAGSSTPTVATAKATMSMWRSAWFPGNRATTPPIDPWQYARIEMSWPTSGSTQVTIPLDSQEADQGQILSLIFYTWTPAATSTVGAVIPLSHVTHVALLYSSDVYVRNETPTVNQYEWSTLHGIILPSGFCGWDLAKQKTGRLTNESCLNTYVQSGVQIRITYNVTHLPNAAATVYVGIESLKYVTQ